MKPRALFSYVTAFSLVFSSIACQKPQDAPPGAGQATDAAKRLFKEAGFDPEQVGLEDVVIEAMRERAMTRDLDYKESLVLAGAWFVKKRWEQAAATYEAAAARAKNDGDKAQALYYAAQSTHIASRWMEAAQLANKANQLVPASVELAAAREAFWSKPGANGEAADKLEVAVARGRAQEVILKYDGQPACEPTTALVIVACAGIAAITTVLVYGMATDKLTRDDVMLALNRMLDIGDTVARAYAWSR
jgi:tetratricopeptide (TPR) repeat protein